MQRSFKMKNFQRIALIFFLAMALSLIIVGFFMFKSLNEIDILEDKGYNSIELFEADERSYLIFTNEFLNENSDYSVLEQLDEEVRLKLAKHMKDNNLEIKPGIYYIEKRVYENGSDFKSVSRVKFEDIFEEEVFEFEKIKNDKFES